jgi:hypothetical protein
MQILKRYWKRLAAVCLMCICLLTLTGCPPSGSSEEYTERDEYAVGEIIRVYKRETGIRLGTLVITNVTVIRDAPYTRREYLCEKNEYINYDHLYTDDQISTVGNKVYLTIEYAAVVQIDFEEDTLDELHKTKEWLNKELNKQNIKLENIFYCFYKKKKLYIIEKNKI